MVARPPPHPCGQSVHGCPLRELRSSAPVLRRPIRRTPRPNSVTPDRTRAPASPTDGAEPVQSGDGTAGRDAEKQLWLWVAQRHQPGQAQVDRGPHDLLQGGPEVCSASPTHLQPARPQSAARRAARGGGAGQTSSREQRKAPGPAACSRWGRQVASASCVLAGADRCATRRASAARLAGLRASCAHAWLPAGGGEPAGGGTLGGQGGPLRGWGGVGKVDAERL